MPETTVKKHGDSLAREAYVNFPARHPGHGYMNAVAKPTAMQYSTNGELGCSVLACLPCHSGERRW
jgi:hypothetical protein